MVGGQVWAGRGRGIKVEDAYLSKGEKCSKLALHVCVCVWRSLRRSGKAQKVASRFVLMMWLSTNVPRRAEVAVITHEETTRGLEKRKLKGRLRWKVIRSATYVFHLSQSADTKTQFLFRPPDTRASRSKT